MSKQPQRTATLEEAAEILRYFYDLVLETTTENCYQVTQGQTLYLLGDSTH